MIVIEALLFGFAVGWLARVIVPGNWRLTWTETIVLGLLGAEFGSFVVNAMENDGWAATAAGAAGSIIGAALILLVVEGWRRWRGKVSLRKRVLPGDVPEPRPLLELMAEGEDERTEFKSTARCNLRTRQRDETIELQAVRSVAGFLNSEGGTLLIGVDDNGQPVGIEPDYEFIARAPGASNEPDVDRYELWLRDHLQRCLGAVALTKVDITFTQFGAGTVCRVEVRAADKPVFVDTPGGGRTADFYVRIGNSTRKLATDEVLAYERTRF